MIEGHIYLFFIPDLTTLFQAVYDGSGIYEPIPGSCVKIVTGEYLWEVLDAHVTKDIYTVSIGINNEVEPQSLYASCYNRLWRV